MKILTEREREVKFFPLLTEAVYESFPALKHTPGQLVGHKVGGVAPFGLRAHGTEPT